MRRFLCVTLAVVTAAGPLAALPNCPEQPDVDPSPYAWVDPNEIVGFCLEPIETVAGKFNRVGQYCDEEGDPVTIELLSHENELSVSWSDGQWTIVGELFPGVHYVRVRATDAPEFAAPATTVVTIPVNAVPPPNTAPILM